MLESEIRNDPLRKHKFAANLTEESGEKKNLVIPPLLVLFFT